MKKRIHWAILAALFLFSASPSDSHAQSVWKYLSRYDFGATLLAYDLEYRSVDDAESGEYLLGSYGLHVGFNVPFKELSEKFSVGVNFGGTLGLNELGVGLLGVPVLAQVKFNNDATWKSASGTNVGFSLGAGAQMINIFAVSAMSGFTYYTPTIMAEFNIGQKKSALGIVKLRFMQNLSAYELGNRDDKSQDFISFSQAWSVGVIFTPTF